MTHLIHVVRLYLSDTAPLRDRRLLSYEIQDCTTSRIEGCSPTLDQWPKVALLQIEGSEAALLRDRRLSYGIEGSRSLSYS